MAAGGSGVITPDFIIYTYDNVEMIWRVLNGVAMIFTNGGGQFDFKTLLKLLGMVGFLVALTSMLFKPGSLGGPAWFGSFILVYTVLMVPVSNVAIINKGVKPGASVSAMNVSNVPIFLAFVGSVTSTIGTKLTDAFDTVFSGVGLQGGGSNPISSYNKYADTGVGYAHQAILKAQEANFNKADIEHDIQQYVMNCSAFDIGDTYSAAALAKVTATTALLTTTQAGDGAPNHTGNGLWNALSFTNRARMTTYTDASGEEMFVDCGDAWYAIDDKIQAAGGELLNKFHLFMSGDIGGGGAAGTQAYKSAFAMAQIGTASMNVKDMLLHTATINAVRKGFVTASGEGNSGGMLLALADAQAVASTNSSYIVQAKLAEQALPMIRNSIEAILYAIFPIVCFLCLILTGSALVTALKGYVLSFIWIQLWAPIYSIINYLGQVKLGRTLVETARHSDGTGGIGINMENFDHIYAGVVSDQAIVGWLLPLVPVIASAIIHGMNQAMGQLSGGSFVAQAGRAAEAAGSGNVQLGNASAGQQNLGPTVNSAFKSTFSDAYGTTTSNIGAGGTQAISGSYLQGFTSEEISAEKGGVVSKSAEVGGKAITSNTTGAGTHNVNAVENGKSVQKVLDGDGRTVTSTSTNTIVETTAKDGKVSIDTFDQQGNLVRRHTESGITEMIPGLGFLERDLGGKIVKFTGFDESQQLTKQFMESKITTAGEQVDAAIKQDHTARTALGSDLSMSYSTDLSISTAKQIMKSNNLNEQKVQNDMAQIATRVADNSTYAVGKNGSFTTNISMSPEAVGLGGGVDFTGGEELRAGLQFMAESSKNTSVNFSDGHTITKAEANQIVDGYTKSLSNQTGSTLNQSFESVATTSTSLTSSQSYLKQLKTMESEGTIRNSDITQAVMQMAYLAEPKEVLNMDKTNLTGRQALFDKYANLLFEKNGIVPPKPVPVHKDQMPTPESIINGGKNAIEIANGKGDANVLNNKGKNDQIVISEAQKTEGGPLMTTGQIDVGIGRQNNRWAAIGIGVSNSVKGLQNDVGERSEETDNLVHNTLKATNVQVAAGTGSAIAAATGAQDFHMLPVTQNYSSIGTTLGVVDKLTNEYAFIQKATQENIAYGAGRGLQQLENIASERDPEYDQRNVFGKAGSILIESTNAAWDASGEAIKGAGNYMFNNYGGAFNQGRNDAMSKPTGGGTIIGQFMDKTKEEFDDKTDPSTKEYNDELNKSLPPAPKSGAGNDKK